MALSQSQDKSVEVVSKGPIQRKWWKESTVYQIYPASFCSTSTSSGTGDLQGIISKLDYIKQLGVDIVWLSPILSSPQVDMGYDISDYRDIDYRYGTMADHDALVDGLHQRGLKYVMDLVVNHTSDEHEWFKASKSSKDNEYRDWYIWRPARYDPKRNERMPPNNWESYFSGSAWKWDETTEEYYLHLFATEQPDLNWENPKVVKAVHDVIRFWLDKGVDGFRMDVINFISKEPGLPDAPITKPGFLQSGISWHSCGPRLHEFLEGIGSILTEYNAFSVGEMPGVTDAKEIVKGVGQDRGELGMAFQFEIVDMDHDPTSKFIPKPFSPSTLRNITNKWQTFMLSNSGWNALYIENHDQGRSLSRYASDDPKYRTLSSKMLATFLALQSGTVFVYQGQELAMANVPQSWASEPEKYYRDIECLNHWAQIKRDNPGNSPEEKRHRQDALYQYRLLGRDNARTPVQWSDKKNAGFTPEEFKGETWMSVHPDYATWNAEKIVADPKGAYTYWRSLLDLRKQHKDVFVYGGLEMLGLDRPADPAKETEEDKVIAYLRIAEDGHSKALIVASFSGLVAEWNPGSKVAEKVMMEGKAVAHSYDDAPSTETDDGTISLRPYEAAVWMLD